MPGPFNFLAKLHAILGSVDRLTIMPNINPPGLDPYLQVFKVRYLLFHNPKVKFFHETNYVRPPQHRLYYTIIHRTFIFDYSIMQIRESFLLLWFCSDAFLLFCWRRLLRRSTVRRVGYLSNDLA